MRILLTGATGFISSYFLGELAKEHEVFALGRRLPDTASDNVTLIPCDLASSNGLDVLRSTGQLPEQIDTVAHMAVSRFHREFPESAMDLFNVNCNALQHLMQYAVDAGAKNVVVGSTCSVYDGMPSGVGIKETDNPSPTRYWPTTKYAADSLALMYQNILPVSVLRFATPYGPDQYDRLIPAIVNRVKNGVPVSLPPGSDGMVLRPIFVSDASEVLRRAITDKWTGVFNVAGEEVVSLREVANTIGQIMGKDVIFEESEDSATYSIFPNVDKLKDQLGGSYDFKTIEQGLTAIISGLA